MKSRIILASASPRRQELLTQIGLQFEVCPSEWEEVTHKVLPEEVVQELSYHKAMEVCERNVTEEGVVVIGADTIVACRGQILGKPGTRERAVEMLGMLQGGTHQVYTGVTFAWREKGRAQTAGFYECTDVRVYPMTEEEIRRYVETGEPMDKAGAYGIQGAFAAFIQGICGDYNNVVGLPVGRVYQELKKRQLIG
ncbi:Maf family protein [Eisenbergiella sp.]